VELLSELRAMLMPLLTATGERPAANRIAPGPNAAESVTDDPPVPPVPAPAVPPLPLPRRTPAPRPVPRPVPLRTPALPVPSPAPPADGADPMLAADGEEAWW